MRANQQPIAKALASLLLGLQIAGAHSAGLAPAKRVVTIGGALTETVYALGAAEQIAAVDSTSTYPLAATQKPQVGYQRNLSAEGLLSVQPDLIIATSDAGPPATLAQIKDSGVALRIVPLQFSAEAVSTKIRLVAEALGLNSQGQQLEEHFKEQWQQVQTQLKRYHDQPKVLFILSPPGANQLLAAGQDTSAEAMIKLAGGQNAISGFTGYKPLSAEAAIAAAPDVLLIASIDDNASGQNKPLWNKPGLKTTPAVQKNRIITMDPLYLLGFGPRLPAAVHELAEKIHRTGS